MSYHYVITSLKINEWIRKQWYIYTMKYYTAERKKELLSFATTWIELESIILSEISQAVKDKYVKQILMDIKREIESNIVMTGNFNTPLLSMDKSSIQKINKEMVTLNDQ